MEESKDMIVQDYKNFVEEWRIKLKQIESAISKVSLNTLIFICAQCKNITEFNSLKEIIDTMQSEGPSFQDFLVFYNRLIVSPFFSNDDKIKTKNQSEFISNKEKVDDDIEKCCGLHKLLRSSISIEELKSLLDRLLSKASELDISQIQNLLNSVFRDLEGFELIEISTNKNKEYIFKVKEALIDFVYQFKDKRPRLQSKGALDVFNQVMDFVCKHRLKPSIELQEKYSKTELNKLLQFPSHEFLQEKIDIEDDVYNDLKKVYNNIGHFNYFFDSDIPLKTVPIEVDGFKGVEISHRTDDTNECYGAGINIFSDGQVFQGYHINGERYFKGRLFWPDGEIHNASFYDGDKTGYLESKCYIGTCLKGEYQGKGRYNFESQYLNCSEFKINNFHGPTTQYFVNGDIKICMYQDDDKIHLD